MSKYTTELRYICEEQAGRTVSGEYTDIATIIAAARPNIFNFDYPYYNALQKQTTEENILRHFYTREICEETYGLWKLRLQDKMNLIMPYYKKLFESAALEFDPLRDVDLTEIMDQETSGRNHSETTGSLTGSESGTLHDDTSSETTTDDDNSSAWTHTGENGETHGSQDSNTRTMNDSKIHKYSDTPQGSITNLQNDTYLTNASIDTDTLSESNTGSGSGNSTTTFDEATSDTSNRDIHTDVTGELSRTTSNEKSQTTTGELDGTESGELDYTKTTRGKSAGKSYSELLEAYRRTLLRIDSMICEELEDLFMLIW